MGAPTVIAALRQFLPEYLATRPVLSPGQWRAVHAILHCRTPAMGGHVHACPDCGESRFAWHSCNHKACPQCGGDATAKWVERQLVRRIKAPCFIRKDWGVHVQPCGNGASAVKYLGAYVSVKIGPVQAEPAKPRPGYLCPCCGKPMLHVGRIPKPERGAAIQSRAPPTPCAA